MKIGTIDIDKFYIGGLEVDKIYLSTEIVYESYVPEPTNAVKFTSTGNSSIGLASKSTNQSLEYTTDKENWQEMSTNTSISLGDNKSVWIRGVLSGNNAEQDYTKFTITGSVKASGNINYIWSKNNPSTPLKTWCGWMMFHSCLGLRDITELTLPATTLTEYCYDAMFLGCGITSIPSGFLPATTLAEHCYQQMFRNCIYLTSIPSNILPATTLAQSCYNTMFRGCTSLVSVPSNILPATTLVDNCYQAMFYDCTSLENAPDLNATTLVSNCYNSMFRNCSSLTYIRCLATDISATSCLSNWVNGVAAKGIFRKSSGNTSIWTAGVSGYPSGWLLNYSYLTFTANAASTIGLAKKSSKQTLYYWKDNRQWSTLTTSTTVNLAAGEKLYLSGNLSGDNTSSDYTQFTITGNVSVGGGRINYIFANSYLKTSVNAYACYALFSECTGLTDASGLSITNITTNKTYEYAHMFYGCTNLVNPPSITATGIAERCYYEMFRGCTKLATAPNLPSTSVASYCYAGMFYNCKALTAGPDLPASNVNVGGCYYEMFRGCSKLKSLKCLATSSPGSSTEAMTDWMKNVSSTGDFYYKTGTTWITSYAPSGWTKHAVSS